MVEGPPDALRRECSGRAALAIPRTLGGKASHHAPAEPPLPPSREGRGYHQASELAFAAPFLCNRATRWRHQYSLHPTFARSHEVGHDGTLYARRHGSHRGNRQPAQTLGAPAVKEERQI